ncbi:MAG: type II toxin-antitoxin system RelE/ParE family toxin [Bacteroidales bacterium]|nr:type II toxin-antitoxin system RelE/ParE family toxin [Bacteroidales bacterium]
MADYILSQRAKGDLRNIWIYTKETWSVEQANKYYRSILLDIDQITEKPTISGVSYDYVRSGVRGVRSGKHIIFYRILSSNKIRVVRILHERMDYYKHL